MSTPHSTNYRPPFPVLEIVIRTGLAQTGSLPALLDTGADGTLVPLDLLEELGAPESGTVVLRTHFGDAQRMPRFLVDIEIENRIVPGVYVIADGVGSEIILGRDVLNRLPLFIDGVEQQTELLNDATVNRLRGRRIPE